MKQSRLWNSIYLILVIVLTIMLIPLIWDYLNLFQIDLSGHIASSNFFYTLGYHQLNDQRYTGYITNLFYPPLEDSIVGIIRFITQTSPLVAFKIYFLLCILVYYFCILRITRYLQHNTTKILFIILSTTFLFIDKGDLSYFQGLGFLDALFTGLTSQFLGGILLLLLIDLILSGSAKWEYVSLLLALGILSHLITGPIGFLFVGFYILYHKKYIWGVKAIGCGILLSAGFRGPFLLSSEMLIPANILKENPQFLLYWCLFCCMWSYHIRSWRPFLFAATAFILIGPVEVQHLIFSYGGKKILPDFHRYRFHSIVLLFTIISSVLLIDQQLKKEHRGLSRGIVGIIGFIMLRYFSYIDFGGIVKKIGQEPKDQIVQQHTELNDGRRIFTIDKRRPIDFTQDSILSFSSSAPSPIFAKGLFWESTRSNTILASYIAMLLAPNDAVVPTFFYYGLDCTLRKSAFEQFIRRYALGRLIVSHQQDYLPMRYKECLMSYLGSGGNEFLPIKINQYYSNNEKYTIYSLSGTSLNNLGSIMIDPIFKSVSLKDSENTPFKTIITDDIETAKQGKINSLGYILAEDNTPLPKEFMQTGSSGSITNRKKIGPSTYSFFVNVDTPTSFRLRFSPFPGRQLYSLNGTNKQLAPLIYGYNELYAYGKGEYILTYKRQRIWYLWYGISCLGLILIISSKILRRKKIKTVE